MVKLQFTNATAHDHGYGLEVNGKSLEEMISVALGTRKNGKSGYNSDLPDFDSTCCDITVIINPQPKWAIIEVEGKQYNSLQEMEEDKENNEEFKEADSEK